MADVLDMAYINSLPQPFLGRMLGGRFWPIHDIEVQTGLVRIDVCGKLDVKHISDFTSFRDDTGVWRSSEAFYVDANEDERAPITGVIVPATPQPAALTPGEAYRIPGMVCGRCGCADLMHEGAHQSGVPVLPGQQYEGRACVDGVWLPWHPISAEVYENRQKWPRELYEVRRNAGVKVRDEAQGEKR